MIPALKSYVRNTKDVLNKLDSLKVDDEWFYVGIDVGTKSC